MDVSVQDLSEEKSRYYWSCLDCNYEELIGDGKSAEEAIQKRHYGAFVQVMPPEVTAAEIEVIRPHELKIGDHILWSSCESIVLEIRDPTRFDDEFVKVQQFADDPDVTMWLPRYSRFYRVKSVLMKEYTILNSEGEYATVVYNYETQSIIAFQIRDGKKVPLVVVLCAYCGDLIRANKKPYVPEKEFEFCNNEHFELWEAEQ
jgi:hypothetical protein